MTSTKIKANKISYAEENTFSNSQKSGSDDLIQEARNAKYFLDNYATEFNHPQNIFFYVISSRWLREWKHYTSYDNVTNNIPPGEQHFGQIYPSKINQDIIFTDYYVTKYPGDDNYRNVVLRPGLEKERDYEIVTEAAWKFFAQKYDHVTIKRPAHILSDGKKIVEVELMQIHIVSITNHLLRDIDHSKTHQFPTYSLQASAYTTIKDFKSDMIKILNSQLNIHLINKPAYLPFTYYEVSEDRLHLWLLDPALDLNGFFTKIKAICNASYTYDYQIEFQGIYLEKDTRRSLRLGEIYASNEETIFLDTRLPEKVWTFFGDGAKFWQSCEYCSSKRDLLFVCDCKKVIYRITFS